MKIWIVEYFEIEGHTNLAVCTSLEKAKEFLAKCGESDDYESYSIHEYETDVWCWYPHGKAPPTVVEIMPIEVA